MDLNAVALGANTAPVLSLSAATSARGFTEYGAAVVLDGDAHIVDAELARRESEALLAATERLIDETTVSQRFTAEDVCGMHRLWLGETCVWAGEYRQVNMEKDRLLRSYADSW